jgi:hypothetical protein
MAWWRRPLLHCRFKEIRVFHHFLIHLALPPPLRMMHRPPRARPNIASTTFANHGSNSFVWERPKTGETNCRTCFVCVRPTLNTTQDVHHLAEWAKDAFDYMAMGNFPYPSSYLMNGASTLPAFPVRVACSYMTDQDDFIFNHPNTTTGATR